MEQILYVQHTAESIFTMEFRLDSMVIHGGPETPSKKFSQNSFLNHELFTHVTIKLATNLKT